MSTPQTCFQHSSEEIRFFCEECHVFVCDDCVSGQGKHIRCTKIKLREYGNKNKNCLIGSVEEITSKKLPHIKRTLELAKNVKGSFNKSMDENIADVRSKTQIIKAILDELQKENIRALEESRLKGNMKFDEFINYHQKRYSELAHITEEIQQQKSDILPSDVVKYDFDLKKNLNIEHDLETIPKLEPSCFEIAQQYLEKEFYQDIFLCKHIQEDEKTESCAHGMEKEERSSSPYYLEPVSHAREANSDFTVNEKITTKNHEENSSDIYVSKSTVTGASTICNKELSYTIIKKFECKKSITFIVPKTNVYEAWVIGMDISEINLKQQEPKFTTLLPHIDGEPITAGKSKKHGLLIGLRNRKSIKLLQEMTGTQRRTSVMNKLVSHIPAHPQNLSAICTVSTQEKNKDIALLLRDYQLQGSKEKGVVIQWFSDKKLKTNELNISNNIEIENPVYMDEYTNGNICITCAPDDKSSWIQLLDKQGNHKMRYPPKDEKSFEDNIVYSFIGAGFLRDGRITILDRVCFRQHLLDDNGQLIKIDQYQNQPSSFAVDIHDNIWIGFDDGTVQVMEYKDADGWYEDVQIKG